MARNSGTTLTLLQEFENIFSDKYGQHEKVKRLVKNYNYVRCLFEKLTKVVNKYTEKSKNLDENKDFLNQLETLKSLIIENVKKSTQDSNIISMINDYILAIKSDYKIIRNYVQTLEDINIKIKKHISKGNHYKSGQLIERAIENKISNCKYSNDKPPAISEELTILQTFSDYFIQYASCIRELLENKFDDKTYRLKLEYLQAKLFDNERININNYFSTILSEVVSNRGYSTEILLEKLVENETVHTTVANNSQFYSEKFIEIFTNFKGRDLNLSDKRCIESLCYLVYQLDEDNYKSLHVKILDDNAVINLVLKLLYDKGIYLYSNKGEIKSVAKKTIRDPAIISRRSADNLRALKHRFSSLFSLILSRETNLINILQGQIIDEDNAKETFQLLSDIYGPAISNLDFAGEIVDVKYCFNYHFFQSLKYQRLHDVPIVGLGIFCRLLFYIHICDSGSETLTDASIQNGHETKLKELKMGFLSIYNEDNHKRLEGLVEILKIMINIGKFDFRYRSTRSVFQELDHEKGKKEKLNVKVEMLKQFFNKNCNEKEICLRLARSFNIHLLKDVIKNEDDVISKLCGYNWYFNLFIEKLNDLQQKFNVATELSEGFSIPYYLSAKLIENDDDNELYEDANSDENQILQQSDGGDDERMKTVMSILFKVFTCSSEEDKEEFLKNRKYVGQEFNKLLESVKSFMAFYGVHSLIEIYNQLRDKSIGYILQGFSGTNKESLKDRNRYAERVIKYFINYRLDHINKIIESNDTVIRKTRIREIFNTFDDVLKRQSDDNLLGWVENTSKLGDKIYFLYCYYKYSEEHFDREFKKKNPDINVSYETIQTKRESIKAEFSKNIDKFKFIKIDHLQHNQVGALSIIYDYLENSSNNQNNLFFKIGTGQGKSLIIVETARKIIELNRSHGRPRQQIFIVTCYDHLAKRDYHSYANYYIRRGITAMYCSSLSSPSDFYDKDVIYLDLETYFDLLRQEAFKALKESKSIQLPDTSNSVLIMDEFDSLILDSDEIRQRIFYFETKPGVDVKNIASHNDVKRLFDSDFIDTFDSKFNGVFDRWCDRIIKNEQNENKGSSPKLFQDGLGKERKLADTFLSHLSRTSHAGFIHCYLDPLTFYSKFKQVIGFSGSITANRMHMFKTLFQGKNSIFYKIPPFFGSENLKANRTFTQESPAIIENRDDFLKAIRDEIRKRHEGQPILIFADSFKKDHEDQSDYECIRDNLLSVKNEKNSFLEQSALLFIESENEIDTNIHLIGKSKTITLATRILGRGADIKVDKHIEKGLHLILTYYPKRENIYTQMLGRTARQDEKGSYSEIVRYEKNFDKDRTVVVDGRLKMLHEVNEYFYKNITPITKTKVWPLFSCLIQYIYTDDLPNCDLNRFVRENILKIK